MFAVRMLSQCRAFSRSECRGNKKTSTEEMANSSEVSFDSSEVSFDSSEVLFRLHVEIFYFLPGDLKISTWRLDSRG